MKSFFIRTAYFKHRFWRQQKVWLNGWSEYWDAALRHYVEGQPGELKTLIAILRRQALLPLWLPLLGWRSLRVLGSKDFPETEEI